MFTALSTDTQDHLRVKLSAHLPERVAEELSHNPTIVTYAPGSIVFSRGSSTDLIFWVVSGYVKIYCPVRDDHHILARIAGPGDVLDRANIVSLSTESTQAFEAQASTRCTIAVTPRRLLLRLLENLDPASLVDLMARTNVSWSTFSQRLITFLGLSFRQRLEFVFEELASRYGVPDERGVLLDVKLSHAELSEMIDSSRSMVSMLIGGMIAEGSLYRIGSRYVIPMSTPRDAAASRNPASTATKAPSATSLVLMTDSRQSELRQINPVPIRGWMSHRGTLNGRLRNDLRD
jgi:CRP-like cAMP-binding protein